MDYRATNLINIPANLRPMIGKKDLLTVFVVLTVISGFALLVMKIAPVLEPEASSLDDGSWDSTDYDNSDGDGQASSTDNSTVNDANATYGPSAGDTDFMDAGALTPGEEERTADSLTEGSNNGTKTGGAVYESAPGQLIPNSMTAIFVISGVLSLVIFARLKTEDILAGVRKYIYVYIQENPGVHLAAIRKEFELSSSSARHHLYVLEESDLIISYKAGKKKHYYLNKSGYSNYLAGKEYKAIISALKNDTSRNIVKYLLAHKDANQKKLSEILDIHPSTVNWHAKRLGDVGIIRSTRRGKDVLYSVNAEIDLDKIVNLIEGRGTLA